MDDLIAFVTARLDEDEVAAKAILEDPDYEAEWHEQSSGVLYVGPGSERYPLDGLCPIGDSRLTRYIARHDPARVLREVEAKRAMLAEHDTRDWRIGDRVHDCQWQSWPCNTLRQITAVWADHPDYRDEWRP